MPLLCTVPSVAQIAEAQSSVIFEIPFCGKPQKTMIPVTTTTETSTTTEKFTTTKLGVITKWKTATAQNPTIYISYSTVTTVTQPPVTSTIILRDPRQNITVTDLVTVTKSVRPSGRILPICAEGTDGPVVLPTSLRIGN